jgi:hypothetical protein
MKTFTTLTSQWKKAVVLGALTLAPTLAAGTAAQAAPFHPTPNWNNQRVSNQTNYRPNDSRGNIQSHNQTRYDGRFDNSDRNRIGMNQGNDNRFDNNRFENNRNDHNRNDYRRDNDKSPSTGKLLGAGIIGAIIGAVISR